MNKDCAIIRDLLPLYVDEICSDASRELVRKHLDGCAECSDICAKLQNPSIVQELAEEKGGVIRRQAKVFVRKSAVAGSVIAGVLMIPVLVCFIVNLASGHTLDWFFIVLTSLLLTASLTVVPLMMPDNKFLWTVGTFTVSLLLLFGMCCLFSGGHWFLVASSACLFGLSVLLAPFIVHCVPVKKRLGNRKALAVFTADTLLMALMFVCIGLRSEDPDYWRTVLAIVPYFVLYAWGMFLIIRYVSRSPWLKTGLCLLLSGVTVWFANIVPNRLLGLPVEMSAVDRFINFRISVSLAAIGLLLVIIGFFRRKERKK